MADMKLGVPDGCLLGRPPVADVELTDTTSLSNLQGFLYVCTSMRTTRNAVFCVLTVSLVSYNSGAWALGIF